MAPRRKTVQQLAAENEEVRARLAEAEETLRAIREGEVDAVVVSGPKGEQIYTLSSAEQVYRLIAETMSEAALTVALDGTVLFANAQLGQLLGRPLEQIVGRHLGDFVHPDHRATGDALLVIAQNQPVRQRLVFQNADGQPVPTHVASSLLDQPAGRSLCLTVGDLTVLENSTELVRELRRHQKALHESEFRYRTVGENTYDFEFWIDPEGRYLYASPACKRVYGRDAAEFMADPTLRRRTVHPDDLARFDQHVADEQATRTSGRVEFRIVRPDGDLCWVAHVCQPVFDEHGQYMGVRGSNRDVTERKQAEGELRSSRAAALNLMEDAIEARHEAERTAAELAAREAQLRETNEDLARFNQVAVGRELRMIELKKDVNALCAQAGLPPRHSLDFDDEPQAPREQAAVTGPNGSPRS